MKKAMLLCGVLLALTATMASAAEGLNLRGVNCLGDAGAINRNFACNTNAGTNQLKATFELGVDLLNVSGVEPVVDLAVGAGPVLPEWWEFKNPGSCRPLALSIAAYDGAACFDWAVGQASMNIAAYQQGLGAQNGARVLILNAVVLDAIQNLDAATEYTVFQLNIANTATVASQCTGCQLPACIVFSSLGVAKIDGTTRRFSGPSNGTDSHYATWQGGVGVSSPLGNGCPASTPTRNATWTQVKELFR